MAVYRIMDEELVSEAEARLRPRPAADEEGAPAVGAFTPIGPGRPLTIQLRHVYTGRFPKRGGLFGGDKDVALVSGVKDFAAFAASARALNLISRKVGAHSHLRGSAFDDGTDIVAYSPAVLTDSLTVSIEFAVDSFPGDFVRMIGQSLKALAGVPLMLPHAGLLLGAGEVARLAGDLGDGLFDGRPAFSITETINFDVPGGRTATADFRILSHNPTLAGTHRYVDGTGLVAADGAPYAGDDPYVVISLDGRERPQLADFAATVASSAILQRFFQMKDGATASVDTLMEGVRLASDMRYRAQAEDLAAQIATLAAGPARARLEQQRDAVLRNIRREELRPARASAPIPAAVPPQHPQADAELSDLDLADDTHIGGGVPATASIRVPEKNNPFGRNAPVTVSERDGLGIFEGDIALYRVGEPATRGAAIRGQEYRWPDGVLVWVADADALDLAQQAMAHWQQHTGIRFRERAGEADYVRFCRLGSSWSFVGRQGGEQEVSFSPASTVGSAVHEIGHALGLWHEQSRGDRDRFVRINLDRVAPENRHNFDKHIEDGLDLGAYDYGSVMHYSPRAFSTTGEDTIVTATGASIGQRNGLSTGDIAAIAAIYPETVGRA